MPLKGVVAGLALLSLLFFQNCGDVAIAPVANPSLIPESESPPSVIQICSSLTPSPKKSVDSITLVNLTAQLRNDELKADSDVDGLDDETDPNNTLRIQTPQNILAKICNKSPELCPATANCSINHRFLGLSNCDLGLYGIPTANSIDFDKDNIPTTIEILNGLEPRIREVDNPNPDGDDKTSLAEIEIGRNPVFFDNSANSTQLNIYRKRLVSSSSSEHDELCPVSQDLWEVDLYQLPLAQTLEFNDTQKMDDVFDFSHSAGENVFLIYAKTTDFLTNRSEFWGKTFKLKTGDTSIEIRPDQFIKLGEVTP